MSSGSQSSGSNQPPSGELEQSADSADRRPNPNQELFEQVLQTTLSLERGGNEPLTPEELRTLTAVARRRGKDPLSLETTQELIQAVLRLRFRSLADSRGQWERMTEQIAHTIFDDPQANERLQSLWKSLCEAAQ
jgi:hypothetical protein